MNTRLKNVRRGSDILVTNMTYAPPEESQQHDDPHGTWLVGARSDPGTALTRI